MFDEMTRKPTQLWTGRYYNEGIDPLVFDKIKEECGVFGVYGHPDAAFMAYYGLHALQHRGQESAGMCSSDGEQFHYHRDLGLVKEVFLQEQLETLQGSLVVGHVRYSSEKERGLANAQPLVFNYKKGDLAIATNGNLVNAESIRNQLEQEGSIFHATSDTEVVAHLIARSKCDQLEDAIMEALNTVQGAFAFLFMTQDKLIAAVDPYGLRPLVLGKMGDAYILASETCAFDAVGAEYIRDVEPGEFIVFGPSGMVERRFAEPKRRSLCAMEYIYFSRPDSDMDGLNIHTVRKQMGIELAKESFVDADIVTGVPDSSISAAIGYAEQTGIPYEIGLIKNRYVGRTFIAPTQALREQGVKMKLSAVRKVVEGKRVVMIDDSIVRGTTSRRIVKLLREAGATEVHVRISSPPFQNPCFYGIDTPSKEELIASAHSVEQIRQEIEADSIHFLSKEGLMKSIGGRDGEVNQGLCMACFDDDYPAPLFDYAEQSKQKVTLK